MTIVNETFIIKFIIETQCKDAKHETDGCNFHKQVPMNESLAVGPTDAAKSGRHSNGWWHNNVNFHI